VSLRPSRPLLVRASFSTSHSSLVCTTCSYTCFIWHPLEKRQRLPVVVPQIPVILYLLAASTQVRTWANWLPCLLMFGCQVCHFWWHIANRLAQQRLGDVTNVGPVAFVGCQICRILWWALPQPSYKAVGFSETLEGAQPSPCFLSPR
jgi:hypothetical protein